MIIDSLSSYSIKNQFKYKYGVIAVVALIVLTGCINGPLVDDEDQDSEGEYVVGVVVAMDPAEQEEIFENLDEEDQEFLQESQQKRMQGESFTQEEQERIQRITQQVEQAQMEASQEAIENFEFAVEESERIQIEDSLEVGDENLYLVSGSSDEILDLFELSSVQAMFSEDTYEQASEAEQQQQQPPQPDLEQTPEP